MKKKIRALLLPLLALLVTFTTLTGCGPKEEPRKQETDQQKEARKDKKGDD